MVNHSHPTALFHAPYPIKDKALSVAVIIVFVSVQAGDDPAICRPLYIRDPPRYHFATISTDISGAKVAAY